MHIRQNPTRPRFAAMVSWAALSLIVLTFGQPARADDAAALARAQAAADRGDWVGADAAAAGAGAVGADIITWQRLRAGEGTLSEYEDFQNRHPDWPGMPLLHEKGEVAAARSTTPDRVIAYFRNQPPQTGAGAVAYINALRATGQDRAALDMADRAWADLPFDADAEAALLALYGRELAVSHELRLDRLLWQGRLAEARRMLPRVGADWQALGAARIALQSNASDAPTLVGRVPKSRAADPGLAHDRFAWRLDHDKTADAADLIIAQSKSAKTLGDPAAWAADRAKLARALLRAGQAKQAYRVAASNQMAEGTDYADLEFLAGFIALRRLNDPATALDHFRHLRSAVATPISVARAHYWQARALEAGGKSAEAQAEYRKAAVNQSAFYGLLAAERLGLSLDPALLADPAAGAGWKSQRFAKSSVLQAAMLMLRAGNRTLAKRFFLHLGEDLSPAERADLADLARRLNEPHVALLIAKQAAEGGDILPAAYYPAPDAIPQDLPVSRALALAIARRESEFDPAALSKAGARGLMQVMPATAKHIAPQAGLPYDAGRLFDPAYNVRMGSTYLRQLADKFGASVALIASGYNAGPGRPAQWIAAFGDPRDPNVDVVDWVEMIPLSETRTYVMRVAESVVIYRARLKGASGPVRITAELRG